MDRESIPLADRVGNFEGSQIRVMFDLAEEHAGEDLVRLEIGEPDFDTPKHVVEAAHEAAKSGNTHYSSTRGIPELRSEIAVLSEMAHGVHVDPDTEILVTTGGIEALYLALLTTVDPGDEVIIPSPAWPNYEMQTRLINATPVTVPLPAEHGFELAPDRLIQQITEDTAAVVLTTPCNPTGRVYDPNSIREVVEAANRNNAYIVADVIYERLAFEGERRVVSSIVEDSSNVIEVNSFSKGYAMTGWRIGWLTGSEAIIDAAQQLRQCTSLCPNTISQHGAIEALRGEQEPFDEMKRIYQKRRDFVVDRIESIPHVSCSKPEGTFYVMVDMTALEQTSMDITKRLLTEYGTVTTPGSAFGEVAEGYIRLSFANNIERVEEGLDRIETMVLDELGA
jgi:aspartate aminotransferase